MDNLDALIAEPAQLKHELDMRFLMERYNHELVKEHGHAKTVYTYHAWYRDDTHPSFDIWYEQDRGWRFSDPGAGLGGDVFDLLALLDETYDTFGRKLRGAQSALSDLQDVHWTAPAPTPRAEFTPAAVREIEQAVSRQQVQEAVEKMMRTWDKPILTPDRALDLIDTFDLSYDPARSEILIPVKSADREMVGCKRRRVGSGGKISEPGSNLSDHLYGIWRLPDHGTVLLCEGESDTWAATVAGYSAVGIFGASMKPTPENLAPLKDRDVVVAFDGDPAGRRASGEWAMALPGSRIAPVPVGSDLSDLTVEALIDILSAARPVLQAPKGVSVDRDVFCAVNKDGDPSAIASFSLTPAEALGTAGWTGVLEPLEQPVKAARSDFASARSLNTWASAYGVTYYGTDTQAKKLAALLDSMSAVLPVVEVTDQVGYHNGSFVYEGGYIGRRPVVYLNRQHTHSRSLLEDVAYDPPEALDILQTLVELHDPEVMHAILAWVGLAPLRPVWSKFPVLGVFGSSGSGKSTVLETVLRSSVGEFFSVNLTSTTPFGVSWLLDGSCGVPVWFDEYRYGARVDTRLRLEQHIRDAYDGAPSLQGAIGESGSTARHIRTLAPCVLSGEDFVGERSQLDRTVLVETTVSGQNPDALEQLRRCRLEVLARTYLEWLFVSRTPKAPPAPITADRPAYNLELLKSGWDLLSAFCSDHGYSKLPNFVPPAGFTNPQEEAVTAALRIALENRVDTVIWKTEDAYAVSPSNLVQWALSSRFDVTLPGGNRATRSALRALPGASEGRAQAALSDTYVRVVFVPEGVMSDAVAP